VGWQVAGLLSETGHTVAAALAAGLDSLCLAQAQPSQSQSQSQSQWGGSGGGEGHGSQLLQDELAEAAVRWIAPVLDRSV
jgi:hypothetical protein